MRGITATTVRRYTQAQIDNWISANHNADRAEWVIKRQLRKMQQVIRSATSYKSAYNQTLIAAKGIYPGLITTIRDALTGLYQRAAIATRRTLRKPVKRVTEALSPAQILVGRISARIIQNAVMGSEWTDHILSLSRLITSPDAIAQTVATGLLMLKTPKEIEQDLLPLVDNIRQSARRIARMESLRVAHAAQMEMHERLGEMVIGYQIQATLDDRVRPEHRKRSGKIWYKNSGVPMMQALDMEKPFLPDDWNCRCFLIPVLGGF